MYTSVLLLEGIYSFLVNGSIIIPTKTSSTVIDSPNFAAALGYADLCNPVIFNDYVYTVPSLVGLLLLKFC